MALVLSVNMWNITLFLNLKVKCIKFESVYQVHWQALHRETPIEMQTGL